MAKKVDEDWLKPAAFDINQLEVIFGGKSPFKKLTKLGNS